MAKGKTFGHITFIIRATRMHEALEAVRVWFYGTKIYQQKLNGVGI